MVLFKAYNRTIQRISHLAPFESGSVLTKLQIIKIIKPKTSSKQKYIFFENKNIVVIKKTFYT